MWPRLLTFRHWRGDRLPLVAGVASSFEVDRTLTGKCVLRSVAESSASKSRRYLAVGYSTPNIVFRSVIVRWRPSRYQSFQLRDRAGTSLGWRWRCRPWRGHRLLRPAELRGRQSRCYALPVSLPAASLSCLYCGDPSRRFRPCRLYAETAVRGQRPFRGLPSSPKTGFLMHGLCADRAQAPQAAK